MFLKTDTKLYDYQEKCLRWMIHRENSEYPGGILALDMGLGKTLLTIATICNNPTKTLVVVPKNIVYQWASELEKFAPDLKVRVVMADESNKNNFSAGDETVILVPISLFSAMKSPTENTFLSQKFDRIVIDEAHLIRNHKTKSFKLLASMDSRVKWALTGTPIVKNDDNFRTLLDFIGIFAPIGFAARNYVYRVTKEDAFDLPPLVIEEMTSDFLYEEEEQAYFEIIENGSNVAKAYNAYGSSEARMMLLTVFLRLRQMTTNLNITPNDSDEFYSGRCTKLTLLKNAILSSPVQKTLIFCHFIAEMKAIKNMLESIGHESVLLNGKISSKDREIAIDRFNNDVNFFIIQIDAGGVGLNLQSANRVFINSLHWNGTSELQAIARSHRIGQDKPVMVTRLVINNTIDDAIIALQQKKLAAAGDLLNDNRIKSALNTRKMSDFKSILDLIFGKK